MVNINIKDGVKMDDKGKTKEELQKEFYAAYLELCNKYKCQIGVVPYLKLMSDTNTYNIALQINVVDYNLPGLIN